MLTAERARELLEYDPATGVLRWRVSHGTMRAGAEAGHIHTATGYRRIKIDYRLYPAHRIAFLIMEGRWPHDQIDHEDHNGLNNRWKNLKETDNQGNGRNQRKPREDCVMKIRTNSWHYRMLYFFDVHSVKYDYGTVSLCRYFWMVVLWLGIATALFVFASFLAASMLSVVYALLTLITPLSLPAINADDALTLFGALITIGSICWIATIIVGVIVAQQEFQVFSRVGERIYRKPVDREPGLFMSWLRAKKEKVCPLVEFVSEEDDAARDALTRGIGIMKGGKRIDPDRFFKDDGGD